LFERESVQRHSKKSGAAGQEAARDVEGRVGAGCWWDGGNTSDTLTKCGANGAQRMPDKDNFGAVLQPFDQQQNGAYGIGKVSSTRLAREYKGPTDLVAVPYTKSKRAQSDTDDETWVEGQVNPTLSLFDCGDVRATTIAIQGNLIGRNKGGPQRVGASNEGAMYTMTKADVHGVAVAFHPTQDPISSIDGSVHAMGCGSSGGCATHAVAQAMTVRRLTPRECERLQGFPDDYTLIPWRKKAADDCPDGPRYKALGNSMAVNCMEWIGERIAALEAEKETP
jgi:site-specific DNA-cytosine methylase